MARNILITEIGRDHANDSMRYRVEITGLEQRTFEVKTPSSTVVKPGREEEIKKLFAHVSTFFELHVIAILIRK